VHFEDRACRKGGFLFELKIDFDCQNFLVDGGLIAIRPDSLLNLYILGFILFDEIFFVGNNEIESLQKLSYKYTFISVYF
jgi:hypothetical protein